MNFHLILREKGKRHVVNVSCDMHDIIRPQYTHTLYEYCTAVLYVSLHDSLRVGEANLMEPE